MSFFHDQSYDGPQKIGRKSAIGMVPVTNIIAAEQLLQQYSNANVTLFPANTSAGQNATFGLEAEEIAFEVKGRPRMFGGDFGRFLGSHLEGANAGDQHDMPVVQTSLNGFDTNDGSLVRAQNFAESLGLTAEDTREFLRDAIRAKLEVKGVVHTSHNYKNSGIRDSNIRVPITIQVSGLRTLPCIIGSIRAGSYVEAVPMTPDEYEYAASNYGGFKYCSQKAQVVIREVTRTSIASRIHRNCALFMRHYDALADAFGTDSVAMQSVAAANGLARFAQFSALQFLSMLVEKGVVTNLAGVSLPANGAPVAVNQAARGRLQANDLLATFARGISVEQGTKRPIALATLQAAGGQNPRVLAPRPQFGEIASVLAVLMGTTAASVGNSGRFDSSTREQLQEPETKKKWMNFTKDFMNRVFFLPNNNGQGMDFQHGWVQATQGDPALAAQRAYPGVDDVDVSYNAYRQDRNTRQYVADSTSAAGRFVQLQQIQPMDCIMSVLTGANAFTKDIIGSAVSDGQRGPGSSGCDVMLTPNGAFR